MEPDLQRRAGPVTGEQLPFEILGRLAVGGMAELHLARSLDERRPPLVVVKRILPQLGEDQEFVRMFRDEANLAAALDHPNIVKVYDIGFDGRDQWFSMEYVHGENLRGLLRAAQGKGERLPLEHALTIAIAVASALHYAHERNDASGQHLRIVHRDISPTNVIVAHDGVVKILDFGIAKAAAATHVTQAGMLKGKASYMSPEQCRADPVDRRSDIFSLGILLYELTTMTRLYRAENELAVLHQILTGKIQPPSERVPGYPPELEAIVLKMLQSDPARRPQTALELENDLRRFARGLGMPLSTEALAEYLRRVAGERPWPQPQPGTALPVMSAESGSSMSTASQSSSRAETDETDVTGIPDSTRAMASGRNPSTLLPRSSPSQPTAAYPPVPQTRSSGSSPRSSTAASGGFVPVGTAQASAPTLVGNPTAADTTVLTPASSSPTLREGAGDRTMVTPGVSSSGGHTVVPISPASSGTIPMGSTATPSLEQSGEHVPHPSRSDSGWAPPASGGTERVAIEAADSLVAPVRPSGAGRIALAVIGLVVLVGALAAVAFYFLRDRFAGVGAGVEAPAEATPATEESVEAAVVPAEPKEPRMSSAPEPAAAKSEAAAVASKEPPVAPPEPPPAEPAQPAPTPAAEPAALPTEPTPTPKPTPKKPKAKKPKAEPEPEPKPDEPTSPGFNPGPFVPP